MVTHTALHILLEYHDAANRSPFTEWFDGLDLAMRHAMQAANIRAGELAVTSAGKILFERSYTWAEPGYPITQPKSLFRLASVSKAFTAALAYELVQAGALRLDTRVFPYLDLYQYVRKGRQIDPRLNDITLIQLIENRTEIEVFAFLAKI